MDFINDPNFRDKDAVKDIDEEFTKEAERLTLEDLALRSLFEPDSIVRKSYRNDLLELLKQKNLTLRAIRVVDFQVLIYTKNPQNGAERHYNVVRIPIDDKGITYHQFNIP